MTDFNYFDDWGLEGGWNATQNLDYAPLWDSFNTGYQAQVPTFPQDNSFWDEPSALGQGDNPTNYSYTQNNFPGASTDPWYSDLNANFGKPDLSFSGYETGNKPDPMGYLSEMAASGGPFPGYIAGGQSTQQSIADAQPQTGWDQVTGMAKDGMKWLSSNLNKNKDLLRMLGAGYGAYKQGQAADMQRELAAKMMAQFDNPYRQQYAQQHFNYAQNPGEFFNSPVVQAQYAKAMEQYQRQMAMQGRTNPNEMGLTSANMLNDIVSKTYMPWMQTSYPWGQANQNLIGPYSQLMNQANVSEYNQYNDILKWLYTMSGIPQENIGITQRKDNDPYVAALLQLLGS